MKFKQDEKILIAPYSNMSKSLKEYLISNHKLNFLGYIDRSKLGNDIYTIKQVSTLKYDKILIISPNHYEVIYKEYQHAGVNKSKMYFFNYTNRFIQQSLFKMKLHQSIKNIYPRIQYFLQVNFKYLFEKKNNILILAPDFIDINMKDLYIYLEKQKSCSVTIATDNKPQFNIFKKNNFNTVLYPSLKFIYHSLKARIKILDHNALKKLEYQSLINSKVVQVWHGIPLKKIGHLTNYKYIEYDLMVSTSDFVTDYAFSKLFQYKKIINTGYPRNDVLVNPITTDKQLVLVNKDIYNFVNDSHLKLVVYMPTWRGEGFKKNPINLKELNLFAKENNLFIILKMHPFIRLNTFFDTIEDDIYTYNSNYSHNIVFYPSTDDIYPLLPLSSLLITDYSSIYFDYLLLNKPIIFFIYDKEEYLQHQGDFMLPFHEYTPGLKPETFESLKSSILQSLSQDNYSDDREKMKNLLFSKKAIGKSSLYLYETIQTLYIK